MMEKVINKCILLINSYKISQHLLISLIIRLLLIVLSEIQDKVLSLKYTDIDYIIFSDGARYVSRGMSPYLRETYRYTPFIAILMLPNVNLFPQFGKILFSVLDVISGALIYNLLTNYMDPKRAKLSAIIWLYNPLPAIISTRGSAESIVTTLVLLTLLFIVKNKLSMAGLLYGLVVHFKLYPIIYLPAFYLTLTKSNKVWKAFKPNAKKLKFFAFSAIGFVLPTYWSYVRYGQLYLDESWLYHFHRKDPQHNFSPYFYIYHITNDPQKQKMFAYFAFIPQLLIVISVALYYCIGRKHKIQDLWFAIFVQTAAFVTLNKVITSQYFLWYLCLLPLIWPYVWLSSKQSLIVLIAWLLSQAQWLLPAYLYEFQHWNCLQWVWIASWIFLVTNLSILLLLICKYKCDDKRKYHKKK